MRNLLLLLVLATSVSTAQDDIKFATFNVSLNRPKAGQLVEDLRSGTNQQAIKIAAIIRRVNPDVILLNEFDYDEAHEAADIFQKQYLDKSNIDEVGTKYPHRLLAPVNTGVPSGRDFDNDGRRDGATDAYGFGQFPGQYGMLVLSKLPIQLDAVRTFQKMRWIDMPRASLPFELNTGRSFYSASELRSFRISSKSIWDIPLQTRNGSIHFIVSHPTPPAFDGPEKRNVHRNHDEIRFLADYVHPRRSGYIRDDNGVRGGLPQGAMFILAGDLNADPNDGAGGGKAGKQLVRHPLIRATPVPASGGGTVQAAADGLANKSHKGNPSHDTSNFSDRTVGNLRVDYVLPSKTLKLIRNGIFWPKPDEDGADLVDCSDHRLVWATVRTR